METRFESLFSYGLIIFQDDADYRKNVAYTDEVLEQGFGRYRGSLELFLPVQEGRAIGRITDLPWQPQDDLYRAYRVPLSLETGDFAAYFPAQPEAAGRVHLAPGSYEVIMSYTAIDADEDEPVVHVSVHFTGPMAAPRNAEILVWAGDEVRPHALQDPAPWEEL